MLLDKGPLYWSHSLPCQECFQTRSEGWARAVGRIHGAKVRHLEQGVEWGVVTTVGWEGSPESSRSDGIYPGTDPKVEHILIDGPHWKRPHTPLERSMLSWKGQDFRIRPTWVQVLISFHTGFVSFNTFHTFSWYFTLCCLRSKVNRLLIKDGRFNTSINLSHLSRCHYSRDKVVFVYLLWHELIKD